MTHLAQERAGKLVRTWMRDPKLNSGGWAGHVYCDKRKHGRRIHVWRLTKRQNAKIMRWLGSKGFICKMTKVINNTRYPWYYHTRIMV